MYRLRIMVLSILDTSIIDFGSVTSVTTVIQSTPSQSVNITANEGTGDNNSATVAIVASVAGSLLVLCIIGICIICSYNGVRGMVFRAWAHERAP